MEILKRLLSKWWFYVILLALTMLVPPLVINEAYKTGDGYVTLWSAPDALVFYGTYLSFLGTVVLGVVAVYQNRKAHGLNQQMQKLQQAQFVSMISVTKLEINKRSATTPNFMNLDMREIEIINLSALGDDSQYCYHIDVEFENSSPYPVVQLIAHAGKRGNINCVMYGIMPEQDTAIYIPQNGNQAIRFIIPSVVFEHQQRNELSLSLDFINIFDYRTVATINLSDLENKTKRNEYSYRLAKFTDIRAHEER